MNTPWGGIIDTASNTISGALDAYGMSKAMDSKRAAYNAQMDAYNKANQSGQDYFKNVENTYNPMASTFNQDTTGYREALAKQLPTMGQFDQSKYNVQNYMNPNIAYQQQQAKNQLQQSAAAQGGLYGGGAMKALSDRQQGIAQQNYQQGFQNMMSDRNFGYQDFTNHFQNQLQQYQQGLVNAGDLLKMSSGATDKVLGAQGQGTQLDMSNDVTQGNLRAGKYNTEGDYYNQMGRLGAKTNAAIANSWGSMFGGGKNPWAEADVGGGSGGGGGGGGYTPPTQSQTDSFYQSMKDNGGGSGQDWQNFMTNYNGEF